MPGFDYEIDIRVPFENERQSQIAMNSLLPDPVLKSSEMKIDYVVEGKDLKISFKSVSNRVLRVGVNSTIESLKTVVECFEEFDS